MAEKDAAEKILESYNDVFADIVNALIFNGDDVVSEDELSDAQTFSAYKFENSLKSQERDVAKYWKKKHICISCFGLENQSVVDYNMPIRVMGYDLTEYQKQLETARAFYPVITLVLHFGVKRKWSNKKSLYDMFSSDIDKRLLPFINDYKINVFDVAWLSDEEIARFKSDFRLVAEYLRSERLGKAETYGRKTIKHIHEMLSLLSAISHNRDIMNMEDFVVQMQKRQGGFEVSELFQRYYDEGMTLGRNEGIALGRNEGIALERDNMMRVMSQMFAEGRVSDIQKAMSDKKYLESLFDEYLK